MNILDILNIPFGYVLSFCYFLFNNYFVAIVLFTLFLKLILSPLAIKQKKGMINQLRMRPKEDAIRKKYANNKEKMQNEIMALYKEEGYNPMGGCLPLLLQFPIIISLFQVIQHPLTYISRLSNDVITKLAEVFQVATENNPYFQTELADKMAKNWSLAQSVEGFPAGTPQINFDFFGMSLGSQPSFAFNVLLIIPIFAGVSALLYSLYSQRSMPQNPAAGSGSMKIMTYGMPLFSVWLAFTVPAGVGLYWGLSSAFSILQEFILNKIYKPKEVLAAAQAEAAISNRKKKKMQAAQLTGESGTDDQPKKPKRPSDQIKKKPPKEPGSDFIDHLPDRVISYQFEDDPAVIEKIKAHNARILAREAGETEEKPAEEPATADPQTESSVEPTISQDEEEK